MAFASSLRMIWLVCVGIAGLAFVVSLFMENLEMATETDSDWGLEETKKKEGAEVEPKNPRPAGF